MAPTVSLCMMTPGPPERVRALLELCRDAVDEIVLVVDASSDLGTLDACAELADRRFTVDCSSVVVALGWMLLECRGDWVLRLDDDEVPSAELLAGLPELVADRFPTNIAVKRRWLYRDRRSYIVTSPWEPDYQVRLLRNVPGIWSFPGVIHSGLEVLGERRLAAASIYHADLLLETAERRRAKRDRFVRERPGLTTDGFPVNDVYVPEDQDVRTAPVPEREAALVERVLAALPQPPGARGRGPAPRHVERSELERPAAVRAVLPGAYRAALRFARALPTLVVGETRHFELLAENRGEEWWPAGDLPPRIRLGSRWLDPDSGAPTAAEDRVLFTETVRPGQTTRVMFRAVAPAQPGRHVLEVDLVHEDVRWFGCATRVEVDVVGR